MGFLQCSNEVNSFKDVLTICLVVNVTPKSSHMCDAVGVCYWEFSLLFIVVHAFAYLLAKDMITCILIKFYFFNNILSIEFHIDKESNIFIY